MPDRAPDSAQDPDGTIARLEEERRALLAICAEYDRLLASVLHSKRWRAGSAMATLASKLPGFMRDWLAKALRATPRLSFFSPPPDILAPEGQFEALGRRLEALIEGDPSAAYARARGAQDRRGPRVSVVAILYNKSRVIADFLAALRSQDYAGEIEVILVDDCSGDDGGRIAAGLMAAQPASPRFQVSVIRNERNLGNCASRNRGIKAATGEIICVLDADCMVNRDFVWAHVREHRRGFDVAIGPMGIESNGRRVAPLRRALEQDRGLVARSMRLQDSSVPASSVNCVTRNFSVTRKALDRFGRDLFDERFAYRNAPDTGFGWEDVEMGTSLFEAGCAIAFAWDAISIHVSHPASVGDRIRATGSAGNFAALLAVHPALYWRFPTWVDTTAKAIRNWLRRNGQDDRLLREVFDTLARPPAGPGPERCIVYTAVSGGYDAVAAAQPRQGVPFVRFSDDGNAADGWIVRPFDEIDPDPVRTAKKPKVLAHRYFAEAEWSVWTDGNVQLLADPMELIREVALSGCALGAFKHPVRDCLYEEAAACSVQQKDLSGVIAAQVERYRTAGYPAGNGLAECNVLVRRHGDPLVAETMELWWREIEQGSRRDQLSFNYALWKTGLRCHELRAGRVDVRGDPGFVYAPHAAPSQGARLAAW